MNIQNFVSHEKNNTVIAYRNSLLKLATKHVVLFTSDNNGCAMHNLFGYF